MIKPQVVEPLWPRWMVSPEGSRAQVHCEGDIPAGWKLETPLPDFRPQVAEAVSIELGEARDEYRLATGQEPSPELSADSLRAVLSGGTKQPAANPDEAPAAAAEAVRQEKAAQQKPKKGSR